MRRPWLIAVVPVLIVAAASAWFAFGPKRPAPAPENAPSTLQPAVAVNVPAATPDVNAPPEPAAPVTPQEVIGEDVATPKVAYFPPPTTNLSGASIGAQRVPGPDHIGDIYQIHFDDATQALFMAVIEPDGMRSVWRLDQNGDAERVFAANTTPGEIQLVADGKGVMYVMHDNPGRTYRTGNAFKSWHLVRKDADMFWNVADDGVKTVYGTLHGENEPILYRSPDDGFSWEPWIDFHQVYPDLAVPYAEGDPRFRLRHLHDVIYDRASNLLIVGMGDVARFAAQSADDGKTWQKVWDEGFTAHIAVGGGDRWLLCPDRLHGPGIVLYDVRAKTVTEVWNPIPHGYAGYCYSLADVDGIYYAALHTEANEVGEVVPKFGIIASPDGVTWYPFLEWGPLGNHARTNIWLASAPGRIYASINNALYAFRPLDKSWFEGKKPFPK